MAERIINRSAAQVFEEDLIAYMIEVNRLRQIPDYKDGFKKVHKRIMDVMLNNEHCVFSGKRIKSAAIVGTTMKKSHPHGDSSIYNAMKPLANSFESLYPYIDKQGNWGTKGGDPAAAYRYTEAKLSEFAMDALGLNDLYSNKRIIDWIPTFDNTDVEPEYFPVAIPTLLIQGCFGIGVGIKTELPPHNLCDVVDATIALMYDPNHQVELIPDQCMPCYVFQTDWKLIANKGHGSVTFRGIVDIETIDGRECLVIKSAPDMVFMNSVIDKIEDLTAKKEIHVVDLTQRKENGEIYHILHLKRGTDAQYTRDIIYKKTDLEKNVSIKFQTLDDDYIPTRFNYKSYLQAFIAFRSLTKFRLYYSKLQVSQTALHEKDAYIKALESGQIKEIINKIHEQTVIDDNGTMEYLISLLDITDLQAKFIMNAGVKKLSIGYLNKYKEEALSLAKDTESYMNMIQNDDLILQEIETELLMFKQKYGRPRNTIVIDALDSTIPRGEFKLVITNNNFIKKLPISSTIGTMKNDSIKTIIKVENTEDILIFDELGKAYRLPVHKIPVSDRSSNGIDVRLLVKNLTSNINTVLYLPVVLELSKQIEPYYLTMITANGSIKKMELQDFLNVPTSGILAFKIDNDIIKDVKIVHDSLDIVVYSGQEALRIPMSTEVPLQKRNTKGLKSILSNNIVDGFGIVSPDTTHIVVVTNNGKVNKFSILGLAQSKRNTEGSKVIKLSKGDSIFSIHMCNEHNTLHVNTANTKMDIPIKDIVDGSSISSGRSEERRVGKEC